MTATLRRRDPELFPIKNVRWGSFNQNALVTSESVYHKLSATLKKNGYRVISNTVLSPEMIEVRFYNPRLVQNDFVSVYWWFTNAPDTDFKHVRRIGEGQDQHVFLFATREDALHAHNVFLVEGRRLESAVAYDSFMYRFEYIGGDGPPTMLYFWGHNGPSELMSEVVWRMPGDNDWQLWEESFYRERMVSAWFGHNAELPQLNCEQAHPGTQVVIRPTLELR